MTKPVDTTTKIPTTSTSWVKTVITTSYSTLVPGYTTSTIKGETKVTETITSTSKYPVQAPVYETSTKTELSTIKGSTCYPTTKYEGTTKYSTVTKPTNYVTKIVSSTKVCGPKGY